MGKEAVAPATDFQGSCSSSPWSIPLPLVRDPGLTFSWLPQVQTTVSVVSNSLNYSF